MERFKPEDVAENKLLELWNESSKRYRFGAFGWIDYLGFILPASFFLFIFILLSYSPQPNIIFIFMAWSLLLIVLVNALRLPFIFKYKRPELIGFLAHDLGVDYVSEKLEINKETVWYLEGKYDRETKASYASLQTLQELWQRTPFQ